MKILKNIKYVIVFLAFINLSYAAKVSDIIKSASNSNGGITINTDSINKIISKTMTSVQNDIMNQLKVEIQKVQDSLQSNVDGVINKFDGQIQGMVDNVNNNIVGKAQKLVDDATAQYNTIIEAKDGVASTIQNIMNNLDSLIFLFWLSYRNAKKMVKEMKKIVIDKDLKEINDKLDLILSKLK